MDDPMKKRHKLWLTKGQDNVKIESRAYNQVLGRGLKSLQDPSKGQKKSFHGKNDFERKFPFNIKTNNKNFN